MTAASITHAPATPPASDAPAPSHHDDPPILPQVGSVAYVRGDGTTLDFRVRPFLHRDGDWAQSYPSVEAAMAVASAESAWLGGWVTYGILQAGEGVYQIRPLESENGRAFTIDRYAERGHAGMRARFDDGSPYRAMVGARSWIDFTDGAGGMREPQPLPSR